MFSASLDASVILWDYTDGALLKVRHSVKSAYASIVSFWTPRTPFFDSLDTQKYMSEYADDDFSLKIEDIRHTKQLLA